MRPVLRWVLAICLLGVTVGQTSAQEPNRAGLVVQYGDGSIETACVAFEEPEISGIELLQRSGLPMTYDAQGGITICSIGAEGCTFPEESCFCQCAGIGTCVYWSYHRLDPEEGWRYSQLGAAATTVRPGDVDGWRWGIGEAADAPPPNEITFDSVCADPVAASLPTSAPVPATSTTLPAASPASTFTEVPGPTNTATVQGMVTVEVEEVVAVVEPEAETEGEVAAVAETNESTAAPLNYIMFGALALLLFAGVLWARRE